MKFFHFFFVVADYQCCCNLFHANVLIYSQYSKSKEERLEAKNGSTINIEKTLVIQHNLEQEAHRQDPRRSSRLPVPEEGSIIPKVWRLQDQAQWYCSGSSSRMVAHVTPYEDRQPIVWWLPMCPMRS